MMNTNTEETCRCVGGPLHRHPFPVIGVAVGLTYRLSGDFLNDPARTADYERKPLTRPTAEGLQMREFFVLNTLTDADALMETLAEPDTFWN
jgi:hypothetical protein